MSVSRAGRAEGSFDVPATMARESTLTFAHMAEVFRTEIVEEAHRVLAAAAESCVPLRLIGGIAIRIHSADLPAQLVRPYQDIDLVTTRKASRDAVKLLERLGYTANDRFNAMNAGRRALVYDLTNQRQIDIFVGEFAMCHKVDVAGRLELDEPTIPLAELLLTKLQIVHLNRKDVVDIAALLYGHEIGENDRDTINGDYIAKQLAGDWGLWRTSKQTIESALEHLPSLELSETDMRVVCDRLERLWQRVEAEPKSLRWRSRAKLGDRTRWYDEPEEIDHDRTGTKA
ncbi:MAG: nucleotidyltransferase family protein [Solirubrobacteraceae bacterium]